MSRKLIAILRGIKHDEVEEVTSRIIASGITWIEVPLNSPDALISINKIAKRFGSEYHIGAGTVVTVDQVRAVSEAGGSFIVSPNCNQAIIRETKTRNMGSYPGVFTVSECYTALESGADALKIFPASIMGQSGISAIQAVLPDKTEVFAVGGVDETNMAHWLASGVNGFGIGTALYKPGKTPIQVEDSAVAFVKAYDACQQHLRSVNTTTVS